MYPITSSEGSQLYMNGVGNELSVEVCILNCRGVEGNEF